MVNKTLKILFLLSTILIFSCTDKFDPGTSSDPDENTGGNIGDTLYVPISPAWEGFNKPQDMIIGKDNFIYVADTENDRIVMMDISGRVINFVPVKRPVALAQDHRLNLIVAGEFDFEKDGFNTTYGAVYKLDLFAVNHNIADAELKLILPDTTKLSDLSRPDRKYTGICVFSDNSYYIARTGPANSSLVSPDNTILRYEVLKDSVGERYDSFKEILSGFEPTGSGLNSTNSITSLTTLNFPNRDFILTIEKSSFQAQWLQYVITPEDEGYESRIDRDRSFMTPKRFGKLEDAAIDNSNTVYLADSEKDSVYIFNSFGDELQSFGGSEVFDSPHSVAFFDKTLYVLDTNNDRILRFILSTEIE